MRPLFFLVVNACALLMMPPLASKAEAFKALYDYAPNVALPILTPVNGGSIAIIGKKGPTYTFLTSAHVVSGTTKGESNYIDLTGYGGGEVLASIQKDFSDEEIDLVVGTFRYDGKLGIKVLPLFSLAPDANWEDDPTRYEQVSLPCDDKSIDRIARCDKTAVASIGDGPDQCYFFGYGGYQDCDKPAPTVMISRRLSYGTYERSEGSFNNKSYFLKTGTIGDFVVAGYSLPSRSITERVLRVSSAVPQTVLRKNKNGYNLLYEATSTVPGMSGGPVLSARLCPRERTSGAYAGIIGIHGKSEEYGNTGSRSGISLAIPITNPSVFRYLTSNAEAFGIPFGSSYSDLVKKRCSEESFF